MSSLSRREFFATTARTAGVAAFGMAAGGSILAACDRGSGSGSGAASRLGFQLGWLKVAQFAPSYIADKRGYYGDEDISVSLLAGGPSVQTESTITSGRALIGLSGPDDVAEARRQGSKLTAVAAGFQRNPFGIMSRADDPIREPKELEGRSIGVQPSAEIPFAVFLELNGVDPSTVTKVPAGFDPTPLVEGEVDAWVVHYADEPVQLKAEGVATYTMLVADYGYNLFDNVYVVTDETLKERRDDVVGFLRGEIRGYQDNIADPGYGARLTVDEYGKDLGLSYEPSLEENQLCIALQQSDDTREHGLLWMSDGAIERNLTTLGKVGFEPEFLQDLFVTDVLEDVYGGKTKL